MVSRSWLVFGISAVVVLTFVVTFRSQSSTVGVLHAPVDDETLTTRPVSSRSARSSEAVTGGHATVATALPALGERPLNSHTAFSSAPLDAVTTAPAAFRGGGLRSPELRAAWDSRWLPRSPVAPFATHYTKVPCGALVSNFCLRGEQPVYFIAGNRALSSSGGTTMCNEAIVKPRMFMIRRSPLAGGVPDPSAAAATTTSADRDVVRYRADAILVAPFCWEGYGYHLLLCFIAIHSHLSRLGVLDMPNASQRLRIHMLRGHSAMPYFVGSATSWTDGRYSGKNKAVASSAYWEMWRGLVDSPSQVWAAPDGPSGHCFGLGILGAPKSNAVSPPEAQRAMDDIRRRLGLTRKQSRACGAYRISVVQRKKNFKITNLEAVVEALRAVFTTARSASPAPTVEVRVLVLEDMSLREQLDAAVSTDVLVGIHGNGLSWSMLMEGHGAILELWPSHPYNGNYNAFAVLANLAHFHVNGDGKCSHRCSASFDVRGVAASVREHMDAVACRGVRLDTTVVWNERNAAYQARQATKRNRRHD